MNNIKEKFYLKCVDCQHITAGFEEWFSQNQKCPSCGSKHSEIWYNSNYEFLFPLLKHKPENFWHYYPFLPLYDRDNIITCTEGSISVEHWRFLEEIALKKYHIDCKVFVYRNDLNGGTGTFKDVAAALAAAVLKEHNINQYVVASTGNTATSYARYLALAGINCSVFIPDNALKDSEAAISLFGQNVYRVNGDYATAKTVAAAYAKTNNILISSGNIDPLRVEAKKTMVFEWLRQLGKMPDVYIQAVSGGTGPIAIDKAVREIKGIIQNIDNPRFILIQPDKCPPMALSWEKARKKGFPDGFEKEYTILDNPQTSVPTLATGNPATYPIIAKLVQKTKGDIIQVENHILLPMPD